MNNKEEKIWEKLQKRVYPNEREQFFRDAVEVPPPEKQDKKQEKPR